jgi:hypothetical protein
VLRVLAVRQKRSLRRECTVHLKAFWQDLEAEREAANTHKGPKDELPLADEELEGE